MRRMALHSDRSCGIEFARACTAVACKERRDRHHCRARLLWRHEPPCTHGHGRPGTGQRGERLRSQGRYQLWQATRHQRYQHVPGRKLYPAEGQSGNVLHPGGEGRLHLPDGPIHARRPDASDRRDQEADRQVPAEGHDRAKRDYDCRSPPGTGSRRQWISSLSTMEARLPACPCRCYGSMEKGNGAN